MVCEAAEAFHANTDGGNLETLLIARTGQHWKVVNAALLRADKHRLIEFGVSLRTSWLTEKGHQYLANLRTLDAEFAKVSGAIREGI